MKIEINDQFKQAFQTIETTNNCVFVTGNAGTGKTTFLKYFLAKTQKKSLVLAPTGVAALNAGGQTIHSFFKFKPNVTLSKIKKKKLSEESIYKKVETIIIDEASMLRCDILDCIDRFLRLNRERQREVFGGVQIVFIGDLKQLPPVVTPTERIIFETQYNSPYFLNAFCLQEADISIITLTKNYRQQDQNFIDLLNAIRDQRVSEEMFRKLNKQVGRLEAGDKLTIYLCTTNKKAAAVNAERLTQISEPAFVFEAQTDVPAEINLFPADAHLTIKKGAQVMMLNNDFADRWVNGSIGIVERIKMGQTSDRVYIYVRFGDGRIEQVGIHEWNLYKYEWNEKTKQIEAKNAGYFKQYPLKLSWALTIHKSQGKTFDSVIVDMENGAFAPGQLYVALSRCTNFEAIKLMRPITFKDIISFNKF